MCVCVCLGGGGDQCLKGNICSHRSKFFLLRADPNSEGFYCSRKQAVVSLSEIVSFCKKTCQYLPHHIKNFNHIQQVCHLSSASRFPDSSLTLTFYSFSYPLTDQKKNHFYLFTLMVPTVFISSFGVMLKGKNLLPQGANSFL